MVRFGLAALAFTVVACGSDAPTATGPAADGSAGASASAPGVTGNITVFAAASLTEAFTDEQRTLGTEQPNLKVQLSFAGSGALVQQIQQGAPADVIATADTASMQKLVDAGLVEAPTTFAHNRLEIIVASGNPKNIKALPDLARPDVSTVLADPSVPAGKYAVQILMQAGVTVKATSLETDVKSAVARVTSGEADAAIVYSTDVQAAGTQAQGVAIPPDQNAVVDYPIAIVKGAKNHNAAAAFVDAITKGSGQKALQARGFDSA
jgi:molybdate transport system substrate-binding protein